MIRAFQHPKRYWLTIPRGEIEHAAAAYADLLGGHRQQRVADQISIDLPSYSRLTLDEWEKESDAPPDDDTIIVEHLTSTLRTMPSDFVEAAHATEHLIGKHAVIIDRWGHAITLLQIDWDRFEHLLEPTA